MDEAEAGHHPQQAKDDASLPAVEQSKARHDEDAEEGPTNHSSPPSSPSLDKGREEADDAALTPEGEGGALDGEESSAAGLTPEQQQLLSMLNSIVVENDDEEEREEEGKSEEEDGGKDGDEGKEGEEKQDLVDLVEEELGEEDMELETEEKEQHPELVEDSRRLLQAKKEVKEEGDGDQSESENGGEEEQRNPDAQSARPGDTTATEDEWLAQLSSFVAPYAQRTSQRIDQRIERLRIVEEEISALGQFDDALAHFRTQRGELMEQLKQRKERFAQFIANPQVSAVAFDEKWRQTFPWTESIRDTLWRVYQFRRFRPMQEEAINAALSGEDVFVLFATGAGKSLCYELPALYANGVTVVISPLKSLMNDQFNHLVSRFTRKIAKPLHGDLSSAQRDDILQELRGGAATSRLQLKLCYVAPETFFQPYAQEVFKKLHDKGLLSRFVVDEAHVVHEWEHFRPQYMNLSRLREKFPHVPITTTTATAPPPVIEKVCENLQLHDPIFCINNPPRRELSLSVIDRTDGEQQLIEWIKANWPDDCGIVYALTIKMVESLCKALQKAGIVAGKYFKDAHNKEYTHDQWMADELKVIVATSAFGMGIDKPDVRYVVFYNLPQSMVQFHQGVGRAGRDGQRADGVIFWSYRDKREILNLQQRPGENQPDKATCETALNTLIRYCQNTSVCRMGAMMEYLSTYTFSGEQTLYRCTGPTDTEGICDNCRGYRESDEEESAAQDLAREVARAILRIAKNVTDQANEVGGTGPISNVTTLVDIFCGSKKGYIRKAGFHLIDDHGKARRMVYDPPTSEFVCDVVKQMLQKGILCEDSLHGRTFISPGEHEARLETTRFRTTCKATKASRKKTKKTSSGGGGKPSKSDKGKEKVTDLDDFDEAEPRPEEEREKRKEERNKEEEAKKKSKTTTKTKKRPHSPSDLGLEADHSDEPRLKRRRTSEPAAESGRSTTSTATSSSSSSRAPTRPRKLPRPRAAKVAASKALFKKEPEYPVEAVVDECTRREKVCVKWEGYGDDQNTWERKKGFVATAPMPYRDFLRRMQLEGRTITRDGPCECRLCREQRKLKLAKEVKNENSKKNDDNNNKKNDDNKNEDNKEKNKKRRKRYSEVSSSDESSADDKDSDSYEQDDDSDAVEERAWKSRNARAVRAEARAELVVIDDDDDGDGDNNSDTGIGEDGGEDELLRSPSPPKR